MFLSLLNCTDDVAYSAEIKKIKQSYLTGECEVNGKKLPLPYAKNFYDLFLKPPKPEDPPYSIEESPNFGNYKHFSNVVAAMAHILKYAENHMDKLLPKGESDVSRDFGDARKLDSMFIAFYHDIGKTIINRRHAVEGKAIFAEPKASVRFRFENIFAEYSESFCLPLRLSYYAESIGAHETWGTNTTGENSVLAFASIVNRFRLLFNNEIKAVKTAIFDLWLANVADIITSINWINGEENKKFNEQDWQNNLPGTLDDRIKWLFDDYKGVYLIEDLGFALQIADAENPYDFAKSLSEKRAVNRFQRLARQTMGSMLETNERGLSNPKINFPTALKDEIIRQLDDTAILAQINGILKGEFGSDFARCFGTMLQFDYALGFFFKLSNQAIYWLADELNNKEFRTGWLYNQKIEKSNPYAEDEAFLYRYNAECIINNYLMALAGVFGEIYRLTADIENWNVEFEDAGNRLTPSKADKLLSFDGAYRAGNARVLLMREIMLYKS
ncbi:MAG: hypothetical protein LBI27_07185 [Clostridiales bacterium]|nr:hypothetical protein [Clostridiales bacterium]